MSYSVLRFFLLSAFAMVLSCRNNSDSVIGEWQLISYSFGIDMDINGDHKMSTNVLDETNCVNNETLTIKSDGTLNTTRTFAPNITVKKVDNNYVVTIECLKGSLGFANSYKLSGDKLKLDSGHFYIFSNGEQLTRTFKDYIKVYDKDLSQVIETKDIILTYIKKQ